MNDFQVLCGKNLDKLKDFPDNYFDAIVTDPPYGLGNEPNAEEMLKAWIENGYLEVKGVGFMGKEWDAFVPQPLFWKEAFRVLKHGGHIVSFFGTRTYDWGVMAMRLAGFEVRDCIQWIYGSGFPKSHNIFKAIDKKPNLQYIKEWKKWLEKEIEISDRSQKEINEMCGFNAIGYSRYDSKDNWATNIPSFDKWVKMKDAIGIQTMEWDFICDSNENERGWIEPTGGLSGGSGNTIGRFSGKQLSDNSISEKAKQWDGWGSALKPANEPIVLARKPLEKGLSIAENVLKWGTGGINIDGCRVGSDLIKGQKAGQGFNNVKGFGVNTKLGNEEAKEYISTDVNGRFPANLIFTHHPECICDGLKKAGSGKEGGYNYEGNTYEVEGFVPNNSPQANSNYGTETIEDWTCHEDCPIKIMDEQSGERKGWASQNHSNFSPYGGNSFNSSKTNRLVFHKGYDDKGGASRFFYCAKASKAERNKGLEGLEQKTIKGGDKGQDERAVAYKIRPTPTANTHPTIKPIKLMQYLIRLITPPNGIVLDPFMGSGTTGVACKLEGFSFVGIEMNPEYHQIAIARIENYIEESEMPEVQIKKSEKKNKDKKDDQLKFDFL